MEVTELKYSKIKIKHSMWTGDQRLESVTCRTFEHNFLNLGFT